MNTENLKLFLCYSSSDKILVHKLYQDLRVKSWITPWMDEESILPGHNWDIEIRKALQTSDAILICLSQNSLTKEGFLQKEIRIALEVADEKPDGAIFIIPIRLEECAVPEKLKHLQWVDLFNDNGISRLLEGLSLLVSQTHHRRNFASLSDQLLSILSVLSNMVAGVEAVFLVDLRDSRLLASFIKNNKNTTYNSIGFVSAYSIIDIEKNSRMFHRNNKISEMTIFTETQGECIYINRISPDIIICIVGSENFKEGFAKRVVEYKIKTEVLEAINSAHL